MIRIYDRTASTVKATIWSGTEDAEETFTLTDDITNAMVYINWPSSGTVIDFDCTVQIEKGNEATSYTPYQGSTLSIPFHDSSDNPITVYGGRLNVTTGELTVTHAMIVIDNSRGYQKWTSVTASGFTGFSTTWTIPNIKSGRISLLCDKLKSIVGVINDNNVYVVNAQAYFCIETNIIGGDTVEAWSAWLASNPIQLVYELATPQTYQLTPAQVTTLLGQNNIFADCGQVLQGEYFVTL